MKRLFTIRQVQEFKVTNDFDDFELAKSDALEWLDYPTIISTEVVDCVDEQKES